MEGVGVCVSLIAIVLATAKMASVLDTQGKNKDCLLWQAVSERASTKRRDWLC